MKLFNNEKETQEFTKRQVITSMSPLVHCLDS